MGNAQQKQIFQTDHQYSQELLVQDYPEIFKFKPFKLTFDLTAPTTEIANRNDNPRTPKPRSGHRVVCDDVNMYSFGGYNPKITRAGEFDPFDDSNWLESRPVFKELWKYNISTKVWRKLDVEDIPEVLASNAVLMSGHVLMVYGGTGVPFGVNCSNDLYICDIASKPLKFNLISATGNRPQAMYGQAIVLENGYLYTVGGTTGFDYTCDVHRLNLRDGLWEAVYTCKGTDDEPAGRYRHEVAFEDNKIYLLGGGTSSLAFGFEIIFAFNLSTHSWEKIATQPDDKARIGFPTPRRCHSCVVNDRCAYIIGGFTGTVMLSDIWKLDLTTFHWKRFTSQFRLSKGVYFHSSCLTSNGKLITFGGIVQSETNSKRTASVHTAWLGIPKLKDICWEAVLFYRPDLDSFTEEELLLLGLPGEFIQKLELPK